MSDPGAKSAPETFSICVGFRPTDAYRARNWVWLERRWRHFFPDAEVCVADSTALSFNRSEARNNAACLATTDILCFADADVIFDPPAVEECLRIVESGGWAIPYRTSWGYFRLGRSYSTRILRSPPETIFGELRRGQWMNNLTYALAGIQILPRRIYDDIGGWDERFLGWGSEDWTFSETVRILWGEAYHPQDRVILHLWHPVNYRERQGQPYMDHNLRTSEGIIEEAKARAAQRGDVRG